MLIKPIKIEDNKYIKISERLAWVCPKGFVSILIEDRINNKDYIYNVNKQDEFHQNDYYYDITECHILDPQKDQIIYKDDDLINNSIQTIIREEEEDINNKLCKFPNSEAFSELAFLGLDNALISALFNKDKIKKKNYFTKIIDWRTRYKHSLTQISEEQYKKIALEFLSINKLIINFPFKFFLRPMGKGLFLHLEKEIGREVTNLKIIKIMNENKKLPDIIKDVSNFRNQAIASLVFHSEISKDFLKVREEKDVLSYLTDEPLSQEQWSDIFFRTNIENKDIILKCISNSNLFCNALNNITIDFIKQISSWKDSSFDQIYKVAVEVPRKLKLNQSRINIHEEGYPELVLSLSVFCISGSSNIENVIQKVKIMHRLGMRRIQDVILFHKDFRSLLKNNILIKHIQNQSINLNISNSTNKDPSL